MKKVKGLFCATLALGMPAVLLADDFEGGLQADIVTSYIWRGQENAGVSIQPSASVGWKGLQLGAWGSYEISGNNSTGKELDLTLSYTAGGFSVGVTDYFIGMSSPFFKYKNNATNHTFEATVGYDFGCLSVNWFTNIAGLDGCNRFTGKRAYSSYLQVAAPFHLAKLDWTASVGMVPWSTDFYAADHSRHFHINSIALQASYDVKCGKNFTLPVFANLSANPSADSMYFFIGCTLKAL